MKVLILAGGLGSRLAEETEVRPKPLVEIGERPILWHIMMTYAHYGLRDFYVALGYKGDMIKRYFLDYYELHGNLDLDLANGRIAGTPEPRPDWRVHLCETGRDTNTGGRLRRLRRELDGSTFMVTYGDGVADIDLDRLLQFHRQHGLLATITAVRPPARFGSLIFDGDRVAQFTEKPQTGEGWIHGGFLVLEPGIFDYLEGDESSLESEALEKLAADGQLAAYRHHGFWQCMDTVRDKKLLERYWDEGRAPWKVWA